MAKRLDKRRAVAAEPVWIGKTIPTEVKDDSSGEAFINSIKKHEGDIVRDRWCKQLY